MFLRPPSDLDTVDLKLFLLVDRDPLGVKLGGKQQSVKQVIADGRNLFRLGPDPQSLHRSLEQYIEQERQSRGVIQVSVAQQHIESLRLDIGGQAENAGTGVEQDSALRQKIARGVTMIAGVIANGT